MVQLSVIIPVTRRYDPIDKLFEAYRKGIEPSGLDFEFIYVLDGGNQDVQASLQKL